MNWTASLAIVLGLVGIAAALGLVWRARTGRVRTVQADAGASVIRPADVASKAAFGQHATLLQFSTEFCAPCRGTRVLLGELAADRDGVVHLDVDLTDRPDLARRFNVMQTPTTLLLDGSGVVRARIAGAPRRDELRIRLDEILWSPHARIA
jgi:thiol-disulfide isomerase/thioredoxin